MKIKKIKNGFTVSFSLLLENDFRSVFPDADWNPASEQWEVGKASEKRLKQWVAEVDALGIDGLIDEVEAGEMLQEELDITRANLALIRADIEERFEVLYDLPKVAADTKKTVEHLEQCKKIFDAVEKQIAIEKAAIQADRDRIEKILAGVVDMPEVRRLAEIMASDLPVEDRANAKTAIEKYRDQLAKTGWMIGAINRLCRWNVNRGGNEIPSEMAWNHLSRYIKPTPRAKPRSRC